MHLIQPSIGLVGIHTFRMFLPKNTQDERLLNELEKWYGEGKGHKWLDRCAHMIVEHFTRKNLTTTVGRTWLAQVLCNTSPQTNDYITHFAVGTDTTPAAVGDTALGTEVFRKAVASAAEDGATANISAFIAADEANTDWEEFGYFVDGTATADSGILFAHQIDSTISKASPNTVTVDSIFTLSDA